MVQNRERAQKRTICTGTEKVVHNEVGGIS